MDFSKCDNYVPAKVYHPVTEWTTQEDGPPVHKLSLKNLCEALIIVTVDPEIGETFVLELDSREEYLQPGMTFTFLVDPDQLDRFESYPSVKFVDMGGSELYDELFYDLYSFNHKITYLVDEDRKFVRIDFRGAD